MHFESFYPFLLFIAPFVVAFLLEGVVIYFFRLKGMWAAIGVAFLLNLLTVGILYGSSLLLGLLGYTFTDLQMPLPAILFFWWLSVMADGVWLLLFTSHKKATSVYYCSAIMNSLSYLFLYFFITGTH